jgi:hypothetical protein
MRKSLSLLLVVVSLLLAACGGAAVPAGQAPQAKAPIFMLALPRVVVNFDAAGNPSILGLNVADVAALTGQDLSGLTLDKATVERLVAANVQNIEVRQSGNGIEWLVDGKLMPYIGWSDASLAEAGQMAALANVQNWQTIVRLLPIVRRLGLDVAFEFPLAAGAAPIPLGTTGRVPGATPAPAQQQPSAIIRADVTYDQNGVPTIFGISAADLAGMGLALPAGLSPDMMQKLAAQNIQSLEISTKPTGLTLYVNNNALPNLVWDEETLQNLIDFYLRMSQANPFDPAIKQAAPFIRNADIGILIHFPVPAGQTPIPVKMQ